MKAALLFLLFPIGALAQTRGASDSVKTLRGVVIETQRRVITMRPDGFLYDATRDVLSAGETTADLLRKLPGIQVDPDGVPSMRGSTRIKVFIDGQPSTAYAITIVDALRMIPAENIAKIEIITQPSARYEGEGVDGVLKIYTKKPMSDGSSGSINGYIQNRNQIVIGNIANRRKQLIITNDLGFGHYTNINWTNIIRNGQSTDQLIQDIVRSNRNFNISAGIGITYLLDSLSTLSAGYRYSRGWDQINANMNYFNGSDSFERIIDNSYNRYIHPVNWSYNRKSKDKKGEFSFIGGWFNHHVENNYSLLQGTFREENLNTVWNKELALELNYMYGGFEAGAKGIFRRYRNASIFIPEANQSQSFIFPRDIYSAYISQTFPLGKYKLRTGFRYEHTVSSLGIDGIRSSVPDYKNGLPNVLLSRVFHSHTLSAAYSRKIFRPWLNYLSPVVNYIDSLNITYGNPYLDPAISNNYDLTWSFVKNRWLINANFFWYQTIRSIEGVAILKNTGILERTYQNIAQNSTAGMATQISFRTASLNVNINNNLRYIDFGNRNGWVNNFTANATYKFTPDFYVSAYVLLNGSRIDLQGSTSGTRYYNFWINKTFSKGKYGLSLRLDNLFMHYQTILEENKTESFIVISKNRQIRRFFRLGFSYKFGKKEIKVPSVRTVSSEN